MARLQRQDYVGDTVSIARDLVGRYLVRLLPEATVLLRITETEAYAGARDRACHAYGYHRTRRNEVMFGPPGHAYVYLIYGMHCCLNFVTNPTGEPEAVLLRGLEVLHGHDAVSLRRWGLPWEQLTRQQRIYLLDGPGKCCKALSLDTSCNGMDLTGEELYLCTDPRDAGFPPEPPLAFTVTACPRVGIDYAGEAAAYPWRFCLMKQS